MIKLIKPIVILLFSTLCFASAYSQSRVTRVVGDMEIPGNIKHTDASYNPITMEGSSYIEVTSAQILSGGNFLLLSSTNPVVLTSVTVRYNYIPPVYVTTGSTDTVLIKCNVSTGEEWNIGIEDLLFSQPVSRTLYSYANVNQIYSNTEYKYWLEIPVGKFTLGKSTFILHFDYKYLYR
jgi:hypothetical protein